MSNLRKSISTGLFIVVAGSFVSLNSQAGEGCSHGPPPFADFDKDASGFVSEEEFDATRSKHMAAMAAEGRKMRGAENAPAFAEMPTFADFDLDGDGKIVEQEFNTGHAKKRSEMAAEGRQMKHVGDAPGFAGIDTNDDGEISEQEFATHQAEHHKQMHESKHKSE
jgi:predicted Fe-Mo cluster-binding NifX family protein